MRTLLNPEPFKMSTSFASASWTLTYCYFEKSEQTWSNQILSEQNKVGWKISVSFYLLSVKIIKLL
jgi:hypothetical protein